MSEAQQPFNALPPSHRLQEYELVRVLGAGGFGITYLGFDHNLDKAVAIKEYLPSDFARRTDDYSVVPKDREFLGDFEWGLKRFVDEAQTLARFDHHHIVKVYRYFKAYGTAYIVMEYAEGETLSAYLERQGTLREAELKGILYPLLDGLAAVHEADILHRDITPRNIMLRDEDGSPVLLDFGAAREVIGERSFSVWTPGYAPIEQYERRGHQGPWTDLYALGGVCYRALTGRVPVEATERVRRDSLVPIGELCGGVSAGLLSAVEWALAVYAEDRPQSVAVWREALEASVEPQTRRHAQGGPRRESQTRRQTEDPRTEPPQTQGKPRREQATERLPLPTPANLAGERERFVAEVGHEPSPDAVDDEGMTDLHHAAQLNLPALSLYLLHAGAAVDARDNEGRTPLLVAAWADASAEMAEILLRAGAAVDARDNEGRTPHYWALEASTYELPSVLSRYRARE